MARKRMIDPGIWQSEDFGKLSTLAKLVFIGLFSNADDEGRGRANAVYLKSILFPYEESIRSADIDKTLSEISSNMSVVFYSCDGNTYYSLYNWDKWQTINRPTPSKIPAFEEANANIHKLFNEHSVSNHGALTPNRKEKEKNRIEKEEKRIRIKDIYNSTCVNLPQIQKITGKREKAIDNFLREFTEEQFEEICRIANSTDFLIGKNERKWKADFDFLMRIDKATNVLEGKYSNSNNGGIDDFKELWKEADNEQKGDNSSNNFVGW